MTNLRLIATVLSLGTASLVISGEAAAQEAVAEEVRVFVAAPFELRRDRAVEILTERMALRATELRSAELQRANENSVTRLLELTKWIPIPLGNSGKPVDTFFISNYMRADLNPRDGSPLFRDK